MTFTQRQGLLQTLQLSFVLDLGCAYEVNILYPAQKQEISRASSELRNAQQRLAGFHGGTLRSHTFQLGSLLCKAQPSTARIRNTFCSSKVRASAALPTPPSYPMGSTVTIFSILCGAFAMAGTITSLCTDCWQINSKGSVVLSTRCRGLWKECVWDKFVRIWTCDVFSSYLNPHPVAIILTRMLLIIASIASAGAFLCLLLGFKYFSCCQESLAKEHCLRLAAGLFFLSGISTSVGVVRYCVYVYSLHQYEVSLKIPGFPSSEFGYSLWMAVGGSLGAIVAAGMLCYEFLFGKDRRASTAKEVASSGSTAGEDIMHMHTYV